MSQQQTKNISGSCLCGNIQFELVPPIRNVVSCYCSECRKSSGNYVSATRVKDSQLELKKSEGLSWYKNQLAAHGFCSNCGSNLFWKKEPANDYVSVMAGSLQSDNGLKVESHLFVADKSDFHQINDSLPQYQQAD